MGPAARPGSTAYGSQVNVQVSAGVPQVKVPDVRGKSSTEAKRILEEAGLEVETDAWLTGDRVVGQNPKPGQTVDHGSTITILLSFF